MPSVHIDVRERLIKMVGRSVALLGLCLAVAVAFPQGYGGSWPQKQKCRLESYTTYEESVQDICDTKYERVCQTSYKEVCNPKKEKVCKTKNTRKCDQKQRQKCSTVYRTVSESYPEEVCKDHWTNKCEQTWQVNGYGSKVWVDDPSTCKEVNERRCETVNKQRQKKVPQQDCRTETYPECYNVPQQVCDWITTQDCQNVPYQECNKVPRQDCHQEHRRIPKTAQRQVCGNGGSSGRGGGYSAKGVNDAFSQATYQK